MNAQQRHKLIPFRVLTRAMIIAAGVFALGWIALSLQPPTVVVDPYRSTDLTSTTGSYVHAPQWLVWLAIAGSACILVLFWAATDPQRALRGRLTRTPHKTAAARPTRLPEPVRPIATSLIAEDIDPSVRTAALRSVHELSIGLLILSQGGDILYANNRARAFLRPDTPSRDRVAFRNAALDPALVDATETARIRGAAGQPVECAMQEPHGQVLVRVRFIAAASTDHQSAFSIEIGAQASPANLTIAHCAHELRTPLTSIRAYAEMLLGSDVGDAADRGRAASVIVSEADRLSLLIDDLLSISQIETGAVQITRRPIRVEDTIEPVIVELGPLARAKSLSLRVTRQETAAEILGDEPRLRQVWTNLVHNAIKYTPSGGTIDVSVMVRDGRVIVTIADTGIGIDPRYHTRIFEMFFRVDDPAVQSQTGTGLGMPIVRELVRLHGGTISLTSNVGTGAIFRVSLPYKPAGGGKKTEAAWRAS